MTKERRRSRVADVLATLEAPIQSCAAEWANPGMGVGILLDGETATAAFGIANIETQQRVLPETLFQIGSISKVFTATVVMTLVDEGLIDLDVPVVEYLPSLRLADANACATITMRHLLTHTSGIYGVRFDDHGSGDDALQRAVAAFADISQQTAPGELWTYCDAGFDLAGRVVEVVTGLTFAQAVRTRLLDPLGANRTTYSAGEAIRHAVSVGHNREADGSISVADPWPVPRRSEPSAGVTTNVDELLRFAQMHLDDGSFDGRQVISSQAARDMRKLHVVADWERNWGLGWNLRDVGGDLVVAHGGVTNGFSARLTLVPERRFALAVLTNSSRGASTHSRLGAEALDIIFGIRNYPTPTVTLERDALSRFVGQYHQDLADFRVSLDSDGMRLESTERDSLTGASTSSSLARLRPVAANVFEVIGSDLNGGFVEFIQATDGSVRFLRLDGQLAFLVGN